MTKISSIYDAIVSLVDSTLASDYNQVPNPYFIEENNDLYMVKGYGVAFGPGNRIDVDTCKMHYVRNFNILLIRQITANDHDVSTKSTIEKAMMEDLQLIRNEFENQDQTLGGNAIRTDYIADSGIELVPVESDFLYYTLNIDVAVEYSELFT